MPSSDRKLAACRLGLLVAGCSAGLALFVCGRQPLSIGGESSVLVVADSLDHAEVLPELKMALERTLITPQKEKIFSLKAVSAPEMGEKKRWRNVILVASLDGAGPGKRLAESMLSQEARARVDAGEAFVFTRRDVWAQPQIFMMLVSPTRADLVTRIQDTRDKLFDLFYNFLETQTKRNMYESHEQKKVTGKLLERFDWQVRVQHDYHLVIEDSVNNFVMLRRRWPERWLFVYWREDATPDSLNPTWCLELRNRLGREYYGGDKIKPPMTKVTKTEFLGREAYETLGIWGNDEKVAGGPFRNYAFFDQATRRLFMIDGAVFAPGKKKEPFMRQLHIIMKTFETSLDKQARESTSGASA